ncbi:hypothetical protein BC834DRAFT_666491 [Gloeopeniophorella convolvens]|nr:hypothetical protein BC834DRAFT_666491 [Gloeopeniophorella convolvens]
MSSESSLITDYLAVVKLIHVLGGLCIWEVASTCYFELDVLRGKRPYRWTIWVYLFCRIACITTFACLFIEKDMGSGHIDCRGWDTAMYFFSYLTLALASFLILLRIFAIWNRNKWVSLLSISVWLLSIILNIRDLFLAHTVWDSTVQACRPTNTSLILDNMIGILVSDIVLLVTMLVGLWRIRGAGRYGLWRLLYHQGILWLALASIAEVLPVVFVSLNINDAFNLMFQPIELTILSVGATRMYRGLSEYGSFTEYECVSRNTAHLFRYRADTTP